MKFTLLYRSKQAFNNGGLTKRFKRNRFAYMRDSPALEQDSVKEAVKIEDIKKDYVKIAHRSELPFGFFE